MAFAVTGCLLTSFHVIGLSPTASLQLNLTKTIDKVTALTAAMKNRQYEQALAMRGPAFCEVRHDLADIPLYYLLSSPWVYL